MSTYIAIPLIVLVFSILLNVFLVWYARNASRRLTVVASNIDDIMTALENFENHLETIYKMETFYGDSVLQGLLEHTRDMEEELAVVANEVSDLLGKPLIPEKVEEETDA